MPSLLFLLSVLYTSLILYTYSFGLPVYFLHFDIQTFTSLFTKTEFLWRIFAIIVIEMIVRMISWMLQSFKFEDDPDKTIPTESCLKLDSRVHFGTQTAGAWRKKYITLQKMFSEQKQTMGHELAKIQRSKSRMWRKFKIKASNLRSDCEAKTKLMASVRSRVASLALEVDVLLHRIQEKRSVLDRQREDNKAILQRYEHIYQEYHRKYEALNL